MSRIDSAHVITVSHTGETPETLENFEKTLANFLRLSHKADDMKLVANRCTRAGTGQGLINSWSIVTGIHPKGQVVHFGVINFRL